MADGVKAHELLLSDEYWQTERLEIPVLPLEYVALEALSGGTYVSALPTVTKVRALYKLASQSGYVPEEIPPGEQLPILPRGEGLLRVIRDFKETSTPKHLTKSERLQTDEDEFDEIADEILANKLYQGEAAGLTVVGAEQSIRLVRTAYYLTGSRTGRILEGTSSKYISGGNDFETTDLCHPVFVGETYAVGKEKSGLSKVKVIKAEILVPGSGSKAKARNKSPKLKLVPVAT